jgi:hypothetical protein
MRKKLGSAVAVAAVAAFAAVPTGASAAHCLEGDSPGFSYFGTDHVKETNHDAEGGNPGPHMGTPGASNCRDTTGSPSARAPGRNK